MNTLTFVVGNPVELYATPILPAAPAAPAEAAVPALLDLACVELARLLEAPVHSLAIRQQYGRIVLVEYQLHGGADPILPLALVDLGPAVRQALAELARHLEGWRWDMGRGGHRQWYAEATRLLGRVYRQLNYAGDRVTADEAAYLRYQLAVCVASPDRRHGQRGERLGQ